jgi:hypothetical protein
MFRTLQDGVPKVPGTAATCPLRQHFMVESTFDVVWSDPGLGHKRTCRPPQVAASFLSRLIVALISPGFMPLPYANAPRNSYAAGSHCM